MDASSSALASRYDEVPYEALPHPESHPADGGAASHELDRALRAEFRAIARHSDSELAHDDLAVPNGTRDRAALASAVKQFAVNIDPSCAQGFVDFALEKFARLGLLMPDGAANTSNGL